MKDWSYLSQCTFKDRSTMCFLRINADINEILHHETVVSTTDACLGNFLYLLAMLIVPTADILLILCYIASGSEMFVLFVEFCFVLGMVVTAISTAI